MCFLLDILELNTVIYIFIKYTLRKIRPIDIICRIKIISFLISIISWALAIVIFVILLILLFPFAIFKLLIVIILRAYHNKNYGGVLESADSLWVGEDKMAYSIINVAFLVKLDKDDDITEYVKNLCKQRFFKVKRFSSIRKSCLGYRYFVGNQLTADDIVTTEDTKGDSSEIWDRNVFREFIQRHSNAPLPRENTAACEFIVSRHPVRLDNTNSDEDRYPILFRVHHSVGDGVTLISMIIQHISDEGLSIIDKPLMPNRPKMSLATTIKTSMLRFFKSHGHLLTLLVRKDKNSLKQPKLSGYKRIGFSVERDKVLMGKVKMIKNMVPDGTFTDVILTGISASLANYFSKNCKDSPEDLILTFMAIADKKDVRWDHKKLRNIFSMASVHLPIDINKKGTVNIVDRYHKMREEYRKSRESCDIRIFYWQLKTFSNILPGPLLKSLIGLNDVTTVSLSNVPGFKKIHIAGRELSHMMFWVPNFVTIGVGFSLITYDDRFQMGLLVDKNIIPDENQVQEILDDVINYIDLLYEEMCLNPKIDNIVTQI